VAAGDPCRRRASARLASLGLFGVTPTAAARTFEHLEHARPRRGSRRSARSTVAEPFAAGVPRWHRRASGRRAARSARRISAEIKRIRPSRSIRPRRRDRNCRSSQVPPFSSRAPPARAHAVTTASSLPVASEPGSCDESRLPVAADRAGGAQHAGVERHHDPALCRPTRASMSVGRRRRRTASKAKAYLADPLARDSEHHVAYNLYESRPAQCSRRLERSRPILAVDPRPPASATRVDSRPRRREMRSGSIEVP